MDQLHQYEASLFKSCPEIIYRTDENKNLLHLNDAVTAITGYDKSFFFNQSMNLVTLIHPDDLERVSLELQLLPTDPTGRTFDFRLHHKTKDQYIWLSNMMFPIFNEKKELKGYGGIIRNISQQIQTTNNLARRNLELITLNSITTSAQSTLDTRRILQNFINTFKTHYSLNVGMAFFSLNGFGPDYDILIDTDHLLERLPKNTDLTTLVERIEVLNLADLDNSLEQPLLHLIKNHGMQRMISIPLNIKGLGVGFIIFGRRSVSPLESISYTLLSTIRTQLNIALENAIRFLIEKVKLNYISILNEMAQVGITLQSRTELIDSVFYHVQGFLHVDEILLVTQNNKGEEIEFYRSQKNEEPTFLQLESTEAHNNLLTELTVSGKERYFPMAEIEDDATVVLNKTDKEFCFLHDSTIISTNSLFLIPLYTGNQTKAVLQFNTSQKSGFNQEEQRFLSDVSRICALCLVNLMLMEAIQSKTELVEEKNEDLQNFIYTISHDLKTPLFSLLGFINIMQDDYSDVLDERGQNFLQRLRFNVNRMDRQIKELLNLSRVGVQPVTPEKVLPKQLIKECLNELEARIQNNQAEIHLEGNFAEITTDSLLFKRVIENIVDNALKYKNPEKPPIVTITGSLIRKNRRRVVKISIADNGIGIQPDDLNRIFTIFHRINQLKEVEGSGAGLTIVKKMMEKLQGFIHVESVFGEGSVFHLEFPISFHL